MGRTLVSKGTWEAGLELENNSMGKSQDFFDWQAVAAEINHCVFEFPFD